MIGASEDRGTWAWQLLMVIFFLAPKSAEADRAIGLLPMVIRIWAQLRKAPVRAWSRARSGHWGRALQGSSALRVAMMRACWAECNLELQQEIAMALVDIEGFFDHIPLLGLWRRALRMNYPIRVLALSFVMYVCPLLMKWHGWCADPLCPGRSVCTGELSGTFMAKALVYEILELAHSLYPLVHADQWVDDILERMPGTVAVIVQHLPPAIAYLQKSLQRSGCNVATKSALSASSAHLAKLLQAELQRRSSPQYEGYGSIPRPRPSLREDQCSGAEAR